MKKKKKNLKKNFIDKLNFLFKIFKLIIKFDDFILKKKLLLINFYKNNNVN